MFNFKQTGQWSLVQKGLTLQDTFINIFRTPERIFKGIGHSFSVLLIAPERIFSHFLRSQKRRFCLPGH